VAKKKKTSDVEDASKSFRLGPSIKIRPRHALHPSRMFLAWESPEKDPITRQNLRLRSDLMIEIEKVIRQQSLTQTEIAQVLGISQPRVSALVKGKINDFRLDSLVNFAHRLGLRIVVMANHEKNFSHTMSKGAPDDAFIKQENRRTQPSFTTPEPYVFVSYTHSNLDEVLPDIGRLQGQGVKLWYDSDTIEADPRPEEIANAIEGATKFLVYLSNATLASDPCCREIDYALLKGIEIVRVFLEELEPPEDHLVGKISGKVCHRHSDKNYLQNLLKSLRSS